MTRKKLNQIGNLTALLSFLIPTMVLVLFYFSMDDRLASLGLLFILFAILVNTIAIVYILLSAKKHNVKGPFYSIFLMTLNIPVAILYIMLANSLYGFYRLKINNISTNTIKQIEIYNCENKTIENLPPNESTTLWIKLNSQCSLNLDYTNSHGTKEHVIIESYLTSGMGDYNEITIGN